MLDSGDGWKVKRIEVRPGHRLSYQTHEFRAEHWVVVSGTATCIDRRAAPWWPARASSWRSPIGAAHRIANAHDEELVIIEVQRGSYTGEDDIVRLDDDYGRNEQIPLP